MPLLLGASKLQPRFYVKWLLESNRRWVASDTAPKLVNTTLKTSNQITSPIPSSLPQKRFLAETFSYKIIENTVFSTSLGLSSQIKSP